MSIHPSQAAPCAACGHARDAHEHYRRGSDCALCDCQRFSDRRNSGYPRESGRVLRAVAGVVGVVSAVRRLGRSGR